MTRFATTLAAVACAVSVNAAPPARAGAGEFSGTVHVNCMGCGVSSGTGYFDLAGGGQFTASFTVYEDPGFSCVITGDAVGWFSGAVNGSFTWTRVFTHLDIRTNGLPGRGTYVVTSPAAPSIPCGGPADVSVEGTLVF
jgi:hypothetical protein